MLFPFLCILFYAISIQISFLLLIFLFVLIGVKTDFIVDTVNAGAGTLAVNIDGPSKVSMDCTEVEEGYKVRYTPIAPGDYYISIKYNNVHIVGSPFKVTSQGNAICFLLSIIVLFNCYCRGC